MQINDVVITPLKPYDDPRGWLLELYRKDELAAPYHPAMAYVSLTRPGITRGPHEHIDQADLFAFVCGAFRLTLWDNRPASPTFATKLVIEGGERYPCSVLVPPGVVHAYRNIGESDATVLNFPNRLYRGAGRVEAVDEIRHEDDVEGMFRV